MVTNYEMTNLEELLTQAIEAIDSNMIALSIPPSSKALQEFRQRIGSGGAFTADELASLQENGRLIVQSSIAPNKEKLVNLTTQTKADDGQPRIKKSDRSQNPASAESAPISA